MNRLLIIVLLSLSFSSFGNDDTSSSERLNIIREGEMLNGFGRQGEAAKRYYYGVKNWTSPGMEKELKMACERLFGLFYLNDLHLDYEQKLANCPQGTLDRLYGKSDRNHIPIKKVAPVIPKRAAKTGRSGEVTVQYTVTTSGDVKDIEVLHHSSKIFVKPSIKAAEQFQYLPAIKDGVVVETENVTNKFVFEMPSTD